SHWLDLRARGQTISVGQLCRECPEVEQRVRQCLSALGAVEALRGTLAEDTPPGALVTILSGMPRGQAAPPRSLPVVAGHEVLGELGRGGMRVVYQARHTHLKRLVALKMILSPHARAEDLARFRTEAEAVARLQHP